MSWPGGSHWKALASAFTFTALLQIAFSGVIELTDENFDDVTADSEKHFLIDIYAPWYFLHCC